MPLLLAQLRLSHRTEPLCLALRSRELLQLLLETCRQLPLRLRALFVQLLPHVALCSERALFHEEETNKETGCHTDYYIYCYHIDESV